MNDLLTLSVAGLSKTFDDKNATSTEATQACLEQIANTDDLGAYLHVDGDGALAQAARADERIQKGQRLGAFDGVPVALKDIFLTEGLPTTCGSKLLENFIAPYDATCVRRLKEAGAIVLGKLNMDEFAMGSSNEHSAFKPALNPWNREMVPGGSSGGSAVAVAARLAYATLGTDTGGSIRQPAAFTGIVGLKPTYGRVSRYGVIAFASSLDQVGPMTQTVTDAGLLLQGIAGFDEHDSTSWPEPPTNYLENIEAGVKGLRIGMPKEYFSDALDPNIGAAVREAAETYEKLGAKIVEVSLPHAEYAIACYYVIAPAEASSNLGRYDGVRYGVRQDPKKGLKDMYLETRGQGFGDEVKRRIMIGTFALSSGYYDAYYTKAQKARTLIANDFKNAFDHADVLLTPTTPAPAFQRGANQNDPVQMYLADIFTVSCNLAGLPGISLPCGFDRSGLPLGMQLIGPHWQESRLLQVARAFEREHDFHSRRPVL